MFPNSNGATQPADARPRSQVRGPADYEASLPADRLPPSSSYLSPILPSSPYYSMDMSEIPPPLLYDQCSPSTGARSKLPRESVYLGPQHHSSPDPLSPREVSEFPHAVLEAMRQMREDNQRLQRAVFDMQRQLNTSRGPVPSPPPPPPTQYSSLIYPPPSKPTATSSVIYPPPPPPTLYSSVIPSPTPSRAALQAMDNCPTGPVQAEVEDGDWPLPPPPVAEEDTRSQLPTAVRDTRPPLPTTSLPTELVEELTACLRNMGRTPGPSLRPPTPEYCEPYEFDESERSQHASESPVIPHRSAFSVPLHRGPADDQRHGDFYPSRQTNQRREYSSPCRQTEYVYRGPKPKIPDFSKGDPREFARLKTSLDNLLPPDATERFKYQILVDHLKFEEALLIADSYTNSATPYTDTMASLTEHYGQPHQLALRRIADLMEAPSIRSHDTAAFKSFALRVRALVGMLDQLGQKGRIELECGSHVTRLIVQAPTD